MRLDAVSGDTIATIVVGVLQLGVGLVNLWQQRQSQRATRKSSRIADVAITDFCAGERTGGRRNTV